MSLYRFSRAISDLQEERSCRIEKMRQGKCRECKKELDDALLSPRISQIIGDTGGLPPFRPTASLDETPVPEAAAKNSDRKIEEKRF